MTPKTMFQDRNDLYMLVHDSSFDDSVKGERRRGTF
jgi:hypothetical protein